MALVNETLFGVEDKVQIAIDRIRHFEPPEGYYLAYSGGKDSDTVLKLCLMAGVKFDAHYNITTVDPPEVIKHIKKVKRYLATIGINLIMEPPKETMWKLIPKKLYPPTRTARYCCEKLKEHGGKGRFVIIGVRWAESVKRKNQRTLIELNAYTKSKVMLNNDNDESRRMVDTCRLKSKHCLNPIIDWEDEDVWAFIKKNGIEYCKLYDEGFSRLGCVLCPMSTTTEKEISSNRWPGIRQQYVKAFEKMLKVREERGLKTERWGNGEDVLNWLIYQPDYGDPNQPELFDENGTED